MISAQNAEAAREYPSLDISEMLIGELEATDFLVISTPMHNFTLPVALKAWIDQIVRFGRTFQSTPEDKIGLLTDRPTYIVIASGGAISEPAKQQPNFLRPYLTAILECIGIRDVTFITAEALRRGDDTAAAGLKFAHDAIDTALGKL